MTSSENREQEWMASFLEDGLFISFLTNQPGIHYPMKYKIVKFFPDTHPGVEAGYVWLDLQNVESGEKFSQPLTSTTRVFVHYEQETSDPEIMITDYTV